MIYGGEGACDILCRPRRRKEHALHADAVLQGQKIVLGVADESINHHCAKNADEIESEVSTKHLLLQKSHVCIIIQNQCSF